MPGLSSGVGSIATLTPKTWSIRWSSVWTLRGVYSACVRISTTWPGNSRFGIRVHVQRRLLADVHAAELGLGHVDADPELRRLEHLGDRLIGGDEVAGPQVHRLDDAVGRRDDRGLLSLTLEVSEQALVGRERGLRGVDVLGARPDLELAEGLGRRLGVGGGGVVRLASGDAGVEERLLAEALALRVLRRGARAGDLLGRAVPGPPWPGPLGTAPPSTACWAICRSIRSVSNSTSGWFALTCDPSSTRTRWMRPPMSEPTSTSRASIEPDRTSGFVAARAGGCGRETRGQERRREDGPKTAAHAGSLFFGFGDGTVPRNQTSRTVARKRSIETSSSNAPAISLRNT